MGSTAPAVFCLPAGGPKFKLMNTTKLRRYTLETLQIFTNPLTDNMHGIIIAALTRQTSGMVGTAAINKVSN